MLSQTCLIALWQMARQQRNRGFGGYHQGLLVRTKLGVVPLQRIPDTAGHIKFGVLRDIGLQQSHLPHPSRGREIGSPKLQPQRQHPQTEQGLEGPQPPTRQRQAHGQPSGQSAHAVHPHPRCPNRQHAIDVRITTRAPRKAGQPAPAHEFGQGPKGCKQGTGSARTVHQRTPGQSHPRGTCGRVIQSQCSR
jgi:hypothetical protein